MLLNFENFVAMLNIKQLAEENTIELKKKNSKTYIVTKNTKQATIDLNEGVFVETQTPIKQYLSVISNL